MKFKDFDIVLKLIIFLNDLFQEDMKFKDFDMVLELIIFLNNLFQELEFIFLVFDYSLFKDVRICLEKKFFFCNIF